jgi:hypothetical protein
MILHQHLSKGSTITMKDSHWRLQTSPGSPSTYRLAQLDDYSGLRRSKFHWNPPATLSLRARVSEANIPGTWGFGFWNDPFSFALGLGGMSRAFPVLPNAAWFFFGSNENYLSFRRDKPFNGFLAAVFRSPAKFPPSILPRLAMFPLLVFREWAKTTREKLSQVIDEDSAQLDVDVTDWNAYSISWKVRNVEFKVNNEVVLDSHFSPNGPLGLVIWVDNQYAAFKPSGEIKTGVLKSSTPGWMEIKELEISPGS